MFKNNEYRKEYYRIIKEARLNPPNGYCEIHHIIPRSLGGTEYHRNLVQVSGADHLRLHTLLPYFTEGENRDKMLFAWIGMTNRFKIIDYEEYGYLKESYSKMRSERFKGEGNPFYGKTHTEETKQKMSKSHKGKEGTFKDKKHSEESKKKMSKSHEGKKYSEESKQKMSEAKKGKKQKIIKCPHCGKEGGINLMKRWHFDNCKFKNDN